jgi:hypothetical protein
MARDEPMLDRNHAHTGADDLGHTFDAILRELERVGRESEATHRQLVQRNRELVAIAAVAQATSTGQLDLAGMLQRALQVVLEGDEWIEQPARLISDVQRLRWSKHQ